MYANSASSSSRSNAISAYRNANETVSPSQAIVMLYDGAIQRVGMARQAIINGEIEARFHAVSKAHAIIQGLQSHLDFNAGGDIAKQLDRYYDYISVRMTMVNLKNDPAICDEIIERLREMRSSWAQIANGGNQSQSLQETVGLAANSIVG